MVLVLMEATSVRAQSNELAADQDARCTCACTRMRDLAGSTIKAAKYINVTLLDQRPLRTHNQFCGKLCGLVAGRNPPHLQFELANKQVASGGRDGTARGSDRPVEGRGVARRTSSKGREQLAACQQRGGERHSSGGKGQRRERPHGMPAGSGGASRQGRKGPPTQVERPRERRKDVRRVDSGGRGIMGDVAAVCPILLSIGRIFQCLFLDHPNNSYWMHQMPIQNSRIQYLHPNRVICCRMLTCSRNRTHIYPPAGEQAPEFLI